MSKSVLWRTETSKFEFVCTKDHRLSIIVYGSDQEAPSVSVALTVEDLRGIEEIISEHRRDIEWDRDHAPKIEEVANG